MGLWRKLSTLRHGRGFGVHSPLAFEMIKSVLPDTPAYYADRLIDEKYASQRQRRIARIILRLIARFQPRTIAVIPFYNPVVKMANSNLRVTEANEDADMSILETAKRIVIRVGQPDNSCGPLELDNEKDLKIVIFRKGLSPVYINTTL